MILKIVLSVRKSYNNNVMFPKTKNIKLPDRVPQNDVILKTNLARQ